MDYLLIFIISYPSNCNPQRRPILLASNQDVARAGLCPGPGAGPEEWCGWGRSAPGRHLRGYPRAGAPAKGRSGHHDQGQQGPHSPGVHLLGADSGAEESDPGAFQKVQSEGMMWYFNRTKDLQVFIMLCFVFGCLQKPVRTYNH